MRLKEDDANSNFFHLSAKHRGRKNFIFALNVGKEVGKRRWWGFVRRLCGIFARFREGNFI